MSDAPIVFKRTKSKASARAREVAPVQDDEEDGERAPSPAVLAAQAKKGRAKAKTKAKGLSFGGDDENGDEGAFKLKKSALSKKLSLGQHPASAQNLPMNLDQASIAPSPARPVYDAKHLSELRATTSSRPRPAHDEDEPMSIDVDSPSSLIPLETGDDNETRIPTEVSIKDAKDRRTRARKLGAAPADEYISLEVTRRGVDVYQGPHAHSRLVREDDELGEGDDEFADFTAAQERIALGKKGKKAEAKQRREAMVEMIADVEDDEETREWEMKQEARAGLTAADEDRAKPAKPVYTPAPIPPATPIPTLDAAMARLTTSLSTLTTSHAQNTAALAKLAEEQSALVTREDELRALVASASSKHAFFTAFRAWTDTAAEFLDAKQPALEKLEAEHLSLLRERADMREKRRTADAEDDLEAFLGAPPAEPAAQEEELDELGRLVPSANPAAARRDRRAARAARRERRLAAPGRRGGAGDDGFSTDASLPPSDAADFASAMASLSSKRAAVLSDVRADEFRDPSAGLGKWFGEWRERYGESYVGAWGGLGLVAGWEFWVRLEMVGWSPFDSKKGLDEFGWYAQLHAYSEGEEGESDLATAMITTAAIPRIVRVVESGGMDPWSARDVRRAAELVEELEMSLSKMDLKYQTLLKAISTLFGTAVDACLSQQTPYLQHAAAQFNAHAVPARARVLAQRRKLLANTLRWRRAAGAAFGVDGAIERLVGGMVELAEGGWEVGGEEAMRKTAGLFAEGGVPRALALRLQR